MDREVSIKLFAELNRGAPDGIVTGRVVEAFANAIKAAERERCAKLCESLYPELRDGKEVQLPCFDGGEVCAAAIRGA